MKFYTYILEYKGGTYLSQAVSGSPLAAFIKGAESIEAARVTGLTEKRKASLIEQSKTDDMSPISGLTNVWCKTALISGELAIVTLVQTDQTTS